MIKNLTLIDGSGYIFRAFYGIPMMTTSSGFPVNAVFGFCTMLSNLLEKTTDSAMAVVFDEKKPTFRHKLYDEYKKNRRDPPESLIPQFSVIREAVCAFQIPILSYPGYEADDIIATYAMRAHKLGISVTIVTSDKDLMQLMVDGVKILDPLKNRYMSSEDSLKKFGVLPDKIAYVQALMGDSIDNIPGIKGIGLKTASLLINQFGTLEALLEQIEKIEKITWRNKIKEGINIVRLSYRLAKLEKNVPLNIAIQDLIISNKTNDSLITFFQKYEFKSLLNRYQKKILPKIQEQTFEVVEDIALLYNHILDYGFFSFDSLNNFGIAIYTNKAFWISESKRQDVQFIFQENSIQKIGWNVKNFDLMPYVEDIMMMHVALYGSGQYDLSDLALKYLNIKIARLEDLFTVDFSVQKSEIFFSTVQKLLIVRSKILVELFLLLRCTLWREQCFFVYEFFDKPLIPILIKMEQKGILIDCKILKTLANEFQNKIDESIKAAISIAGLSFNLASPKQLSEILFEHLQLPISKKTKAGLYMTDSESLKKINHPIIQHILIFRLYSKLLSTYVQVLLSSIVPKTGRVHTTFDMHIVNTGRLNSRNPNLQNIPIKTESGKKVRAAFIAPKNFLLIALDYSQIELRIMAHMARVPVLQDALANGNDIHARTAQEIFGAGGVKTVDSHLRRRAKEVNFSIIYGISPFGLAQNLNISLNESKKIIETYFQRFPEILSFMEECKNFARTHGYVKTLFGRRIYIPNISSKNSSQRAYAERQAINAPIQGTAADIIKYAMIRCDECTRQFFPDVTLLLQVHDELIFESPKAQTKPFANKAKNIMENLFIFRQLSLVVDVSIANNWSAC